MNHPKLPILLLAATVLAAVSAHAASYTNTTTGNFTWSSGTGWSSTPVSASDTTLVLGVGTSLTAGASVLSTNNIASPPFLLNAITMSYNGPSSGSQPNFIISGNAMRFVADGSTNPTINLNATATSPGGAAQRPQLRFSNAVTFANDIAISGASDALFSGTIANEGGATVTKSNSGTIRFDANSASYSGNFVVSGGLLQVGNNGGAGDIGSGTVTLSGGGAFTVRRSGGSLTLNNTIGGTGNVTFQNNGGFTTTVAKANTYTGNTTISPTGSGTTGEVRLGIDNALSTTTLLTITASGASVQTFNLNGFDQKIAALGSTGTTAQAIVTNSGSAKTLTIENTSSTNISYSGLIAGAVVLTKAGAGTQILTGANTYSGTTTVNGGTLQVGNATALGSTAAGTVVNGSDGNANFVGTVLELNGVSIGSGESLTLDSGTTSGNRVTLRTVGTTINTWAGGVSLAGNRTVQLTANTGGQLEISGAITHSSFSGSVTLRGAGTGILSGGVTLSNATTLTVNDGGTWNINTTGNTWGDTSLFNGAMALGADDALPTTTRLTVGGGTSSGTLRLNGWSQTIAGLTTSGTGTSNKVVGGSATAGALTVNLSTNSTFDGVLGGAGADENNFALTKTGTGTLTLSGANANTYTGSTAINAGTLQLNKTAGVNAIAGAISVTNSATLLVATSDQVADTSAVTLSGGTIQRGSAVSEVFGDINITSASFLDFGSGATGTFQFQAYANAGSSTIAVNNFAAGNKLQFLTNSFGIGNLAQFTFDNGTTTSIEGNYFTITAIPEPSTVLAAIGLGGLLLWPVVRRRTTRAQRA